MRALVLAAVLLAGCSNTAWQVSAGRPPPVAAPAHVQVTGGYGAATVFGLAVLAAGAYELTRDGFEYAPGAQRVPEMAPDRKIAEVDCTKPVDFSAGNIRCK